MIKVSVIVPVYNVASYLDQCMESLLAQELEEIEILLIDDASSDQSALRARQYASRYKKIRFFEKEHGGLGDTRNYGVLQAQGEYLAFVDSDDWVEPGMMRAMAEEGDARKAQIVFCNMIREFEPDGNSRILSVPGELFSGRDFAFGAHVNAVITEKLIGPDPGAGVWRSVEMLGCACRRIFHREWFLANGLRFQNEEEVMLEDQLLTIEAHICAQNIVLLNEAFYHYRYNAQSLSGKYRPRRMEKLMRCYAEITALLTRHDLYQKYGERLSAWLLRCAAHGALAQVFHPLNKKSMLEKYREVCGISREQELLRAARAGYFDYGTKEDRLIQRLLAGTPPFVIWIFYRLYALRLFGGR